MSTRGLFHLNINLCYFGELAEMTISTFSGRTVLKIESCIICIEGEPDDNMNIMAEKKGAQGVNLGDHHKSAPREPK